MEIGRSLFACVNFLDTAVNPLWSESAQAKKPDISDRKESGTGDVCVTARHLLRVQEILGRKWELLILTQLGPGPLRHKDLARRIREIDRDLNDGVLSRTLRRLASDGLVYKQAVGKRHVHALTDLGRTIVSILAQITELSDQPPEHGPESDEPSPDPEQ